MLPLVAAVSVSVAGTSVVFTSPCASDIDPHGESRWEAKTDPTDPPTNAIEIHAVTPSEMYGWAGPGARIRQDQGRIESENPWYAMTGRVVEIRAEDDGDLHVVLEDASGDKPGMVVTEIPFGEKWCAMRTAVFSWTSATFPLTLHGSKRLKQLQPHVVTMIGRAFYDMQHAERGKRNNRRSSAESFAVWEIHPVMQLSIDHSRVGATPRQIQPQLTPPPAATPVAAQPEFVTITKPVAIRIPFGTTVLQPGLKLPFVSRDTQTVHVRYMDEVYSIPIEDTDLQERSGNHY
jgi:hypothetical protein